MTAFHWWFKAPTVEALGQALAEYPTCGLRIEPRNADGTDLTEEQVKAFGAITLFLAVQPPQPPAIILNDSFPCPPICPEG